MQFAAYSPFFTEAFEMVYRAMEERDEEAEGVGEGVGEGRMRRTGGKGAFADGVWHAAEVAGRAGRTNITPTDAKATAKAFWDWAMNATSVSQICVWAWLGPRKCCAGVRGSGHTRL